VCSWFGLPRATSNQDEKDLRSSVSDSDSDNYNNPKKGCCFELSPVAAGDKNKNVANCRFRAMVMATWRQQPENPNCRQLSPRGGVHPAWTCGNEEISNDEY